MHERGLAGVTGAMRGMKSIPRRISVWAIDVAGVGERALHGRVARMNEGDRTLLNGPEKVWAQARR